MPYINGKSTFYGYMSGQPWSALYGLRLNAFDEALVNNIVTENKSKLITHNSEELVHTENQNNN